MLDPTLKGPEASRLESGLRRLIVGQDEAIRQIVNFYQMHVSGLTPAGRPICSLLFAGPTGSGKTRLVEATALALGNDARAVVKIDCGEFQHSHEIAKLIGSPPGYLGHRETHPLLSQENLDRRSAGGARVSFVLFDEIEKASDALWNLLLGILDKASLTLGDNRRVNFSRSMIFMTSNLGAREMANLANCRLGFTQPSPPQAYLEGKMAQTALQAARKKFTPEFINRLDKIVVFQPLGASELRCVLDIELESVQERILTDCGTAFGFTVTDAAKEHLLLEGTDQRYGARHLKRAIERLVVQPLANLVASEQLETGDWVEIGVDAESKAMTFEKTPERRSIDEMAALAESVCRARAQSAAVASGPVLVQPAGKKESRRLGSRNERA